MTNPKELMKLMVQITQNIKENINNQHGLEIPAIWLPHTHTQPHQHAAQASNDRVADDVNQITELCATIEQAIHQKVQDNLSQVEHDCHAVLAETKALLAKDELEIAARRSREVVAVFFAISAWLIPLVAFITLMVRVGRDALCVLGLEADVRGCVCLQVEWEEHLPSAVRDAEYVMPAVHAAYGAFQPLLFPERATPAGAFPLCCGGSGSRRSTDEPLTCRECGSCVCRRLHAAQVLWPLGPRVPCAQCAVVGTIAGFPPARMSECVRL